MHKQYLLAALEQANLGQGLCAPNPSVGAIAVQNGIIIAQAHHRGAGTPHAEQLLLAQIPPKTPGVCLYITLEPCNHWGKTPPCVDAIIKHGVEEVVFAFRDPNPLVAQNNSSKILSEQGIRVTHYPVDEINAFYTSYQYWMATQKPKVTVKLAHTLDGKIGRQTGERLILSNDSCAQFTHNLRAKTDVILSTARTIQADNPQFNARLPEATLDKVVAIIDNRLSLQEDALVFSKAQQCHVYHLQTQTQGKFYPKSTFYCMPGAQGRMDLDAVLSHLGGLGYHDVLVEAGGALFRSLHQQGLVHRTYLYLVPFNLGEEGVNAYLQERFFEMKHKVSWQQMGDNMILCVDWLEDVCLQG